MNEYSPGCSHFSWSTLSLTVSILAWVWHSDHWHQPQSCSNCEMSVLLATYLTTVCLIIIVLIKDSNWYPYTFVCLRANIRHNTFTICVTWNLSWTISLYYKDLPLHLCYDMHMNQQLMVGKICLLVCCYYSLVHINMVLGYSDLITMIKCMYALCFENCSLNVSW